MPHDLLAILVPTLTVVVAALMNRADAQKTRQDLQASIERLRNETRADVSGVSTQLTMHSEQFAAIRERLARLEERLKIPA